MLILAFIFWLLTMIMGVLGFGVVMNGTAAIPQAFFWLFLVLFIVTYFVGFSNINRSQQ